LLHLKLYSRRKNNGECFSFYFSVPFDQQAGRWKNVFGVKLYWDGPPAEERVTIYSDLDFIFPD
jgi:SpoVK/Ycf46/Vps4 family AAA+-type ATPase